MCRQQITLKSMRPSPFRCIASLSQRDLAGAKVRHQGMQMGLLSSQGHCYLYLEAACCDMPASFFLICLKCHCREGLLLCTQPGLRLSSGAAWDMHSVPAAGGQTPSSRLA